ncbi:hypothetical protein [Natronocella acetinitrilica]|nr:hypothetical protein [Natronocella acetinitrilica]
MLIKLPRGEIRLPSPYATHTAVNDLLEQILAFEQQLLGDDWEDYHLYLTVDCRSVPAGHTQRNPGWHFDGMQGVRYPKKLPICHQYVVSNSIPTEYAGAPLDAGGLDERKDNWFEVLGGMLPEDGLRELGQPYRIEAMSAYQLHRASVAEETAQRMFMRLDFSLKQQDRLGNTRNPLLAAPWVFVGRTSLGASLPTETGFNRSGRYGA